MTSRTQPEERFLDTNIFLRHLVNDDPQQSPRCLAIFKAIEDGALRAWSTDLAIAEVVWVLTRFYGLTRHQIRELLYPLIRFPGLRLPGKRIYGRVFELYVNLRIDYIDCFHAALLEAEGQAAFYSYDRDFDRIPSLARQEP